LRGGVLRAVDDLHLDLRAGETLGVVGESGCGKSTLARALVGLEAPTSGSIRFDGQELVGLKSKAWRAIRRDIQMVFQDPLASLSPKFTVAKLLDEPLKQLCPELDAAARAARVREMLAQVGLGEDALDKRPADFSGGQAQRIAIARALVVKPRLLICDEPVSALDVSVQAQIVNLLLDLQQKYGLTLLFIAHDLAVVRQISHRVIVMYRGRIVEQSPVESLYLKPAHPYTRALLEAVPGQQTTDGAAAADAAAVDDPVQPAFGCAYHPRCKLVENACVREVPHMRRVGPEHYAACIFAPGAGRDTAL